MNSYKIFQIVCNYYQTDKATILSRTRKAEILEKRQMLQYIYLKNRFYLFCNYVRFVFLL